MDFSHGDHAGARADNASERSSPGGEFVAPPIQRKLAIGRSDDPAESEADRIADQVMRMAEPGPVGSRPSQLSRKCAACENEDEPAKLQIKRDGGGSLDGSAAPPIVHDVLRSPGQPLDAGVRAFMEPRFGHDFSNVRLHTDARAAESAQSVDARAYTVGERIVWGATVPPGSVPGRRILAHELAHIAVGHTTRTPNTGFRQEAPPAPVLPTVDQRAKIMEIFNPQQSSGEAVPEVADKEAFKADLKTVAGEVRAASLAYAMTVQDPSAVRLGSSDLTDLAVLAEEEVRRAYASFVLADLDLAAVRDRLRFIPADPGTAPEEGEATLSEERLQSLELSAVRIKVATSEAAQEVISRHHVLPGTRDEVLFLKTLKEIRDEAPAEWRTIALSFRGWEGHDLTLVQRRIVPMSGETTEQTRRRGRWLNLGTSIHEMLHALTHPDFASTVGDIEQRDLAVEGFTEFFTRRLYAQIQARAASDDALRLRIEGTAGPAFKPPKRDSYNGFFDNVVKILGYLEGNEENLLQAYFRGRVEYIGLGSWNERSRGLPVERRNEIGAAVMLRLGDSSGQPFVRANYGRLVWGSSGAVQLDLRLGAGLTFIGEGQRIGLGPEVSMTLRGGHLFLAGGALVQGSVGVTGSGLEAARFDTVLRLQAGMQIGRLQVGPGIEVLMPIDELDQALKGTCVFGGIGASFVFGP